jgi:DNA invertase Pin-like site-specific DNA recombinase
MIVGYLRTMRPIEECQDEIAALEKEGCGPIFVDRDSGEGHTPTLEAVLEDLSGGDTLVVWALDDLARSVDELVRIAAALAEEGVRFRSLTDDFDSRGKTSVMDLLDRLHKFQERSLARLREQTAQARSRVGRPRALSRLDVERAFALINEGNSLDAVADALRVSRSTLHRYLEEGKRWAPGSYQHRLLFGADRPEDCDTPLTVAKRLRSA